MMSYGSIMSSSIESSQFDKALIRVTGPKTGSTVTVSNGTETLTTVEDNGVWEVSVDKGSWTVKGVSGGITSTKSVTVTDLTIYNVVLEFINKDINSNSWADISEVSKNGSAGNYWSVGDSKYVSLSGNYNSNSRAGSKYMKVNMWAFVIGINHNPNREGGIHFQFGKTAQNGSTYYCIYYSYYDRDDKNDYAYFEIDPGGTFTSYDCWQTSPLRRNLCNISGSSVSSINYTCEQELTGGTLGCSQPFIGLFPNALKNVLRKVVKYTGTPGGLHGESHDYLFIPSQYEVFANTGDSANTEMQQEATLCQQYDFYKNGGTKVRGSYDSVSQSTTASLTFGYPLRTRNSRSSNRVGYMQVMKDGSSSYYQTYSNGMCCLCFVV